LAELYSFLKSLPNYGGTMLANGQELIYSHLELSKPTGKYISRAILRLFNLFLQKKYVRYIGHSCAPGIALTQLDREKGYEQFNDGTQQCGIIIANVPGSNNYTGAVSILADPFMYILLRPHWTSFDAYLKDMSSKYRTRTKRVYVLSRELHVEKMRGDQLKNNTADCAELLFETLKHKTITLGKDLNQLLQCYCASLGEQFSIHKYYLNGKVIGFISYIHWKDEIHAMHLGYDIDKGTELHLYQRMMYDLIDYAIQQKAKRLNLGRTAPEIKSTFGAVPEENSMVFFTKNLLIKYMLVIYQQYFYKATPYVLRHPFKNEHV